MKPPVTQRMFEGMSAEHGILMTLLYFDVFGHPLKADEIVRYAPVPGLTVGDVATICHGAGLGTMIREQEGFYFLADSPHTSVRRRLEREATARRLWPVASFMSRLISTFPFVRGVFVSGELAKGVAGPESDIDYVVLTAERRLWVARTLLIFFKKIFLFNRKRYFCLNHFQSLGHLEAASHSYYAAIEVATLRSTTAEDLLQRYLASNHWIESFLPNAIIARPSSTSAPNEPIVRRIIESMFPAAATDRLDEWLRRQWERLWTRRYRGLTPDERAQRFACTPVLSTAYGTDIADRIEEAWNARLIQHGLSSLPKALV